MRGEAAMWDAVDAALRCALPLALGSLAATGLRYNVFHYPQSTETLTPYKRALAARTAERLRWLPPVTMRTHAAALGLLAPALGRYERHSYDQRSMLDFDVSTRFADLDEGVIRSAAEALGAAIHASRVTEPQMAMKHAMKHAVGAVEGAFFQSSLHGPRWSDRASPSTEPSPEALVAAARAVCAEVDAEPRLLTEEGQPLLRVVTREAIDRAEAWWSRAGRRR